MDPKKKQTTLFDVWKKKSNSTSTSQKELQNSVAKNENLNQNTNTNEDNDDIVIIEDNDSDIENFQNMDFDDEEISKALELSMVEYKATQERLLNDHCERRGNDHDGSLPSTSKAANDIVPPRKYQVPLEKLDGFDADSGQTWIYPTNYPFREYQFNIVQTSLFKNTMVVLPTGLGKTFIAAVIMYNFYRWYPRGKIVFMAPTRPLVNQQIESCFKVMGIPQEDTEVMLGNDAPDKRKQKWLNKRVFFLTPQVMNNDISRGVCPVDLLKCLVIDEAHKAQGNHAYCEVIRGLIQSSDSPFRVIGLSATPGGDMKAVESVLKNLLISHVELRSEDSPDIIPYTHVRTVEKVVVKMDQQLMNIKEKYLRVLKYILVRLEQKNAINRNTNPETMTQFGILKLKEAFTQNPPQNLTKATHNLILLEFLVCITLYHAYELLCVHGTRTFYKYMKGNMTEDKGNGRVGKFLENNVDFGEIYQELAAKHECTVEKGHFPYGHPKLKKLEDIVLNHFKKAETAGDSDSTRVMIFSNYRESVEEIVQMLEMHEPFVRAMAFVGQNSKNSKGISQKMQLQVVESFRRGGYNTLVSTCVGEEGLDIGEVDLIVCYDAHKSPIRLVQRVGRTGRKRDGMVISLVTEGKEDRKYNQGQYNKNRIDCALTSNAVQQYLYPDSPRMVPKGIDPECHKMYMTVKSFTNQKDFKKPGPKKSTGAAVGGKNSSRNSSISNMFEKINLSKKQRIESGFLNDEEMAEWTKNYKCPDEVYLTLPAKSTFLSLPNSTAITEDNDVVSKKPTYDLSKYISWQVTKQASFESGHSKKTEVLVHILNFIENSIAFPDEDPYKNDYDNYLDMKDVYDFDELTSVDKQPEMLTKSNSKRKKLSLLCDNSSDEDTPVNVNDKRLPGPISNYFTNNEINNQDTEEIAFVNVIRQQTNSKLKSPPSILDFDFNRPLSPIDLNEFTSIFGEKIDKSMQGPQSDASDDGYKSDDERFSFLNPFTAIKPLKSLPHVEHADINDVYDDEDSDQIILSTPHDLLLEETSKNQDVASQQLPQGLEMQKIKTPLVEIHNRKDDDELSTVDIAKNTPKALVNQNNEFSSLNTTECNFFADISYFQNDTPINVSKSSEEISKLKSIAKKPLTSDAAKLANFGVVSDLKTIRPTQNNLKPDFNLSSSEESSSELVLTEKPSVSNNANMAEAKMPSFAGVSSALKAATQNSLKPVFDLDSSQEIFLELELDSTEKPFLGLGNNAKTVTTSAEKVFVGLGLNNAKTATTSAEKPFLGLGLNNDTTATNAEKPFLGLGLNNAKTATSAEKPFVGLGLNNAKTATSAEKPFVGLGLNNAKTVTTSTELPIFNDSNCMKSAETVQKKLKPTFNLDSDDELSQPIVESTSTAIKQSVAKDTCPQPIVDHLGFEPEETTINKPDPVLLPKKLKPVICMKSAETVQKKLKPTFNLDSDDELSQPIVESTSTAVKQSLTKDTSITCPQPMAGPIVEPEETAINKPDTVLVPKKLKPVFDLDSSSDDSCNTNNDLNLKPKSKPEPEVSTEAEVKSNFDLNLKPKSKPEPEMSTETKVKPNFNLDSDDEDIFMISCGSDEVKNGSDVIVPKETNCNNDAPQNPTTSKNMSNDDLCFNDKDTEVLDTKIVHRLGSTSTPKAGVRCHSKILTSSPNVFQESSKQKLIISNAIDISVDIFGEDNEVAKVDDVLPNVPSSSSRMNLPVKPFFDLEMDDDDVFVLTPEECAIIDGECGSGSGSGFNRIGGNKATVNPPDGVVSNKKDANKTNVTSGLSSDEKESPIRFNRKRKATVIKDDDDCDVSVVFEKKFKSNTDNSFNNKKTTKMINKSNSAKQFLDQEADVSDIVSDDEVEEIDNDEYEESFVNDSEESSCSKSPESMRKIYLQSVKSPAARGNKYKLQYNPQNCNSMIFSQAVESDVSDYEEDSFCVGNDKIDREVTTPVKKRVKKATRRIMVVPSSSDDEKSPNKGHVFTVPKEVATSSSKNMKKESNDNWLSKPSTSNACASRSSSSNTRLRVQVALGNSSNDIRTISGEQSCSKSKLNFELGDDDDDEGDDVFQIRNSSSVKEHASHSRSNSSAVKTNLLEEKSQMACPNEKQVIFVNVSELAPSRHIISSLRNVQNFHVNVIHLRVANYVVSSKVGIYRSTPGDIFNSGKKADVEKTLRMMIDYYEKPVLILEYYKNESSRGRTLYADSFLRNMYSTELSVLFSESQDETVQLIAELAKQEKKLDLHVGVRMAGDISDEKKELLQFLADLPHVNCVIALNFISAFKTLSNFLNCRSAKELEERGKMPTQFARKLYQFIKEDFSFA